MQEKRILIIEATYGGGHKSITTAVKQQLKKLCPLALEIQDYNFAHSVVAKGYQFITTSNDLIYKFGFWLTDRHLLNRYEPVSMINFYLKRSQLVKILKKFNPDVVFINNQAATQRIPELVHKIHPNTKSVVFVSDPFTPHAMAYNPGADLTLVATKDTYQRSVDLGISKNKLVVTGHPVREIFYHSPKSKSKHKKKLGLDCKLFTVLFGGSGDGADKIRPIIEYLITGHEDLPKFQAVVVTGNNSSLKRALKKLSVPKNFRLQVRGYEKDMAGVMHAADIVVGKAGPNLILETVASKIPFMATYYLNQEKGNIDYIEKHKLGYVEMDSKKAAERLASLIKEPQKMDGLKEGILRERQVHRYAAANIAKQILNLL